MQQPRKRRWLWWGALFIIAAGITIVCLSTALSPQPHQQKLSKVERQANDVPTVFVPGWHSTSYSTQLITDDIVSLGVTNVITTVRVTPQGKFIFVGPKIDANSRQLIRIVFENNRAGEVQYAKWLHQLLAYLYTQDRLRRVNLVGHSMGAYASTLYTFQHGAGAGLPAVNKLVTLAGPFNGIIGRQPVSEFFHPNDGTTWTDQPHQNHLEADGRPAIVHPEYARLEQYAPQVPKTLRMLNIYGDLGDGSQSDGVVTVPSATSIGYLVKNRIAVFHQVRVIGPNAQHSALHEHNWQVTQNVVKFLWPAFGDRATQIGR
ncbi:alpha/beta hydrolase [Schleiferilactobacillus harbinensis]|uniref:Alpha/beta hydrolase n=1 Tax=Schleiferilactobacillus harbinensis TaxID=304207 RepID=A0ABU7SV85_9LACO|nr:alpha/beta hydrolase [Schleiferilactobacillus harbinensis]MBO3090485.1 alpha/beta hydrolase [Schleiferilactobacillus harbinensis]MCI1687539.1 alpha/beta hydrolase [Schleiferilactobacillus harbinensis]MCI1783935.1 alpha/beta hydrolase [Schleiferilactobacillus harbinensis]MCI1851862.1 alpha/beta hydrolase [Schleiferilactobacillus harbinensis]MCT2908748.1 alpha/beta hydrolase [Schleiferilactobacillus harbinensis]